MNYEWGPWIEHDGSGCPVKGQLSQVEYGDGDVVTRVFDGSTFWDAPAIALPYSGPLYVTSWDWSGAGGSIPAIRYRVRRPLVSEWLAETTSDLPVTEDA
jgi:hypothetical protein